jgi:hypothetical protein
MAYSFGGVDIEFEFGVSIKWVVNDQFLTIMAAFIFKMLGHPRFYLVWFEVDSRHSYYECFLDTAPIDTMQL